MTIRTGLRRILALATALGIGALSFATQASADSADINPNARASLTIHKCIQPDQPSSAGSGLEIPNACTPLNGVEFTIYKVDGIDLTTSEGWNKIQTLTAPENGTNVGPYSTTRLTSMTTSGNGTASWTNLDLGLYLVRETDTGAPNTGVVLGSKPFLVTLPYNSENAWNYNVHVYPKNSLASLTKTVDDSVQQAGYLGKNVKWTITTDIPHSGQGTSIDSYVITDTLPAGMTVTNISAEINNNGGWLSLPSDLNCVGSVTCTFTSDGLAKLRNLGGRKVLLHLTVDVTDVTASDQGVFTNKAQVTINGTDSVEVSAQTTWGQLRVYKYDRENLGTLQDAKFSLCLEPSCDTIVQQDVATNDQGILNFPVLRPGTYYLVETTPPAGYVLDATPQEVTVLPGNTEPPADATARAKNYHTMSNVKQNVPQLPLTGGIGQVALAAGGIGLLLIGAMVMITSRMGTRRNRI